MSKGVRTGLIGGAIIALIYIVLLWIKFTFLSYSPFVFYLSNFVSYLLIICCFVFLALQHRRAAGGYAEIKDLFQPIFIAILFAELAYFIFTFVYLNYVKPNFFEGYEQAMIAFAHEREMPKEALDKQVEMVRGQAEASRDFWLLFKGVLLRWIVVDSIFGIIIAFLLRKRTPQQLMDSVLKKQQF